MKSTLVLILAFALAATVVSAQSPAKSRRAMTVEDLWKFERVGSPAVSPDGRWVAFTVSSYSMEDNESETDLWLVAADGSSAPRQLTWNEGGESNPVWSPDGRHLAFTAKRGEGPPQLHLLPMAGGEAEPLTELPVSVQSPRFTPDGKKVVFLASTFPDVDGDFEELKKRLDDREENDKTKAKITETRFLRYWDQYRTDGLVPHFFELDLESREIRDLTPGNDRLMGFRGVSWDLSPDGQEIAFAANDTEKPYQTLDFNLFLLDLASGEMLNVTGDNPAWDSSPLYSPDGRYLVYGRTYRPEIAPDMTRLVRYDRESGEVVDLTTEWDREPSSWRFTPDGETLVFHAQDGGRDNLYKMPIDGGEPQLVVEGGDTGNVEPTAGGRLVFLEDSIKRPDSLFSTDLEGGDRRRLTAFNDELLAELDLGEVEDVTFEGAGGDPVQAWVVLPPGFDASKKWPLLVLIHGGPHGAWLDSFHYRWNAALFAAPGYVVIGVNFHGSTGFGQAFTESILGNHAEKPYEDVMAATDFMLERGYVDPERLAAAGGSYGGYMVSWILGHTDRYKALVNHAGVYDLMAQFASDYTWSRGNNYGADPWEDPERIDLYSPSRYAAGFETPTLILHGELDYRVPVTQGINLHGVLQAKGVPSRIVIFPDENHWILKPQAAKLWWSEVHGWLERWIGKGPSGE